LFEDIDIYPYRRVGNEQKKKRADKPDGNVKKIPRLFNAGAVEAFTPAALAVGAAGFLLGRAVLLGDLMPFAASFVAASIRVFGRNGILAVPAVLLGLATISQGTAFAGTVLAVLGTCLLTGIVPADVKRPWLVLPALVFAVTVIAKTTLLAFTTASSYLYFTVLFEAIFAALLAGVMDYGLTALKRKAASGRALSSEEIFCTAMLFGGLVAGTGDLKLGLISIKGVLSGLVILLSAMAGGTGAGAAAGAVVGIIPGLAYVVAPVVVGAYSFAGLLAGLGRNFGKAGAATGFMLGNIILTVYLTDYNNLVTALAESGVAALLFLIFPSSVIEKLKATLGITGQPRPNPQEGSILKEIFKERIKNWSQVFYELARSFEQVSSTVSQTPQEQSLQKLLHLAGEKVCSDCSFYRTCWERDFYKTYQVMVDLVALIEIYGKISPDNFPTGLKKRCSRTKELAITLNCLYESYNLNRYWSQRLLESREIVSEQLKGIAGVMANLPGELELDLDAGELAPRMRRKLKEAGVKLEHLAVINMENGGSEVVLSHTPCGGMMKCASVIQPLLSSLLEQPVYKATPACTMQEGETACSLRFYPDLKCRLTLGVARTGKEGSLVCGDSHAFFHLKGGRLALVLSDGMGVGPRAALESGITISLLGHLLESGFGQDLAIKTVNSILVLRSPGESFATVDLAVVNVYTGQADFVKIGAVPTFILREREVDRIKASSLPVGIIEDIDVASMSRKLQPGDTLVMVTDGVLDAYQGPEDREDWLAGILEDVSRMAPQQMAELILKLAQTSAGGATRTPDDMTVLVARLETAPKYN
jgi:stage II sporulation protein E